MNKSIILAVVAILAQFAENNVSAVLEVWKSGKLDWCCAVVKLHKNVPHATWNTLDDAGIRQEWGNKGCDALVGENKVRGSAAENTKNCKDKFNSAKDWCCAVVDLYSKDKTRGGFNWGGKLVPGTTWGGLEGAVHIIWSNTYNCDRYTVKDKDTKKSKCD